MERATVKLKLTKTVSEALRKLATEKGVTLSDLSEALLRNGLKLEQLPRVPGVKNA